MIRIPANSGESPIYANELDENLTTEQRQPIDYELCMKLDKVLAMGTASACEQVFGVGKWTARRIFKLIKEWAKV